MSHSSDQAVTLCCDSFSDTLGHIGQAALVQNGPAARGASEEEEELKAQQSKVEIDVSFKALGRLILMSS